MAFYETRKLDFAARPKEILIGRTHVSEESYKISMKTSLQKQNTVEQLNFLWPRRNFVALQQLCSFLFLWEFIITFATLRFIDIDKPMFMTELPLG